MAALALALAGAPALPEARQQGKAGKAEQAPIGLPGPKSPWGKPTLGKRTRVKKPSDKFITRRRGK